MLITQPWAVYNEIEEYAADWLENLIAIGAIAKGVVDRRSIVDIQPDDYRGFRQAHFFAGVGVWSYALRRAGVPDDTALWTGSCPCQPFSAAGQGAGVADERHLWPAFFHLIQARRPPRIYGEQVASKDGLGWLDLVLTDMEASDYTIWAVDTPSAGSGGPHIRQRLRFCADDLRSSAGGMAHSDYPRPEGWRQPGCERASERAVGPSGLVGIMADTEHDDRRSDLSGRGSQGRNADGRDCSTGIMADADGGDASTERQQCGRQQRQQPQDRGTVELADTERLERGEIGLRGLREVQSAQGRRQTTELAGSGCDSGPGPTNGFWRNADWLFCRDDKWRPIEPGTLPLVDGAAFRVGSGSAFEGRSRQGMLKAYGNAVDAEATADFIEATLAMGDDIDDLL